MTTSSEIPPLLSKYYDTIYKIGEGTYGIVYKATSRAGREVVAIKQFKSNSKDGEGISITACREIMLLREVDHENIVRMKQVLLNPMDRSLFLIFDFSEYDLYEIIKYHREKKQRPFEFSIKSYLWQMLNGIHYLHSCWILHRDLKPSNILVMGEGPEVGRIKIADFGLARIFQSPLRPLSDNGVVVTIWYRAPELLLSSNHYSRAIDIWAIGCIFAELFLTKPLFAGHPNSVEDQISKIYQILGTPTPERWPGIIDMPDWQKIHGNNATIYPNILRETMKIMSDNAFDLLSRMIEYDPEKRITASEALDHPYFFEAPLPSLNAFDKSVMPNIPFPTRKATDNIHH